MSDYSQVLTTRDVEPGDWFVVAPQEELFEWIEMGESLVDRRKAKYGHAGIASRWVNDTLMIVEAEPHGAVERPWHWEANPHLWSTGTPLSVPGMADAALRYAGMTPGPQYGQWTKTGTGTGYSFLDYLAIETHSLHIPVPGLRHYIETTRHMICSQLVDQCAQDAELHLFSDGRWPGYVKPSDLEYLLEAAHAA